MSEIQIIIFVGFIRMLLGTISYSKKGEYFNRLIIMSLGLSFIYSTLVTIMLIPLFRPVILVIGSDSIFNYIVGLYFLGVVIAIYVVELKNNLICLSESYDQKKIKRRTVFLHLVSHPLSLFLMVIF